MSRGNVRNLKVILADGTVIWISGKLKPWQSEVCNPFIIFTLFHEWE